MATNRYTWKKFCVPDKHTGGNFMWPKEIVCTQLVKIKTWIIQKVVKITSFSYTFKDIFNDTKHITV